MKADVAFVSCVKLKVDHPAPARDLYMRSVVPRSTTVRRASGPQLVHPVGRSWSAGSGLRDRTIRDPSDGGQGSVWRRAIVLVGKNYRQHLINPLILRFKQIDVPIEGLMMCQRLQGLSRRQAIES